MESRNSKNAIILFYFSSGKVWLPVFWNQNDLLMWAKVSIFKNGHNLQIRGIDKDEGKDKHHAIAFDLRWYFLETFKS